MINQISQAIKFTPAKRPALWLPLLFFTIAGGFLALLIFVVLSYQLLYLNRAYPGVTISGEKVGGLNRAQIVEKVNAQALRHLNRPITIQAGAESWSFTGQQLGLRVDVAATADKAFEVGRQKNLFSDTLTQLVLIFKAKDIQPVIHYDTGPTNQVLQQLSNAIDYPPQNAQLVIQTVDNVEVSSANSGRRLHVGATQPLIEAAIFGSASPQVTAFTQEVLPDVTGEDLAPAQQQVQALLSQPFIFNFNTSTDNASWQLSPEQFLSIIKLVDGTDANGKPLPTIELNRNLLAPYFEEFAKVINQDMVNARLYFNDDTGQLDVTQQSRDGRTLDVEAAYQQVAAAMATGSHVVHLPVTLTPATISSNNLEALGIKELVSESTSYFQGSSEGRIRNIALSASKFDGVLVPPDGVFSFNQELGPITKEAGYDDSLVIFGERTQVGVGGGVCQVSTTAFRAAFYGGFEIVERWAHGYRVGWYETNSIPGLDATIYTPDIDFKFRNDSGHYLLIQTETELTEGTVTFKFFGTAPQREVTVSEPIVSNIAKPAAPLYEETPGLLPGTVKQIDWAKEGMNVTVTRMVKDGDTIIRQDEVVSNYQPWRAVYQVGPQPIPQNRPPASPFPPINN